MSTPHLGILADRLLSERTGVARYLMNLLTEWSRWSVSGTLGFGRVTLYTRDPLPDDLHHLTPTFMNQVVPSRQSNLIWEQWVLPRRITGVDVLFCPGDVAPLAYRGRTVVTTHDLLAVLRPGDFPFSNRFRRRPLGQLSARRSDRVLTDAAATIPLIVEHYGVAEERIRAIPLAADALFTPKKDDHDAVVTEELGLGGVPFVLFVGKLARRRHIPDLLAAFGRIRAELPHRLVIVGPNPLRISVPELARRHQVQDRVQYLGFVGDRTMRSLYRMADVFVYPSEMEGFGLPVLEAMQSGTAVITLDRPSLVEVGGDAPYYLGEATVETLAAALVLLVTDSAELGSRVAAGLERAREFSWAQTARRTLESLTEVARVSSPTNR